MQFSAHSSQVSELTPPLSVLKFLGMADYVEVFAAMKQFTAARDAATPDEFWQVMHPPVFTLGLAADRSHVLSTRDKIALVQVDRGGEVTYHGPGQVVVYTLLDLRRGAVFVRDWVHTLEAVTIEFLARYQIRSARCAGAPGVYIAEGHNQSAKQSMGAPKYVGAKIAALGLKVTRGCCYHGVALNIAMDLAPFSWINPCGMSDLTVVDMDTMRPESSLAASVNEIAHAYAQAVQHAWQDKSQARTIKAASR